jgi:hypothetical protein
MFPAVSLAAQPHAGRAASETNDGFGLGERHYGLVMARRVPIDRAGTRLSTETPTAPVEAVPSQARTVRRPWL